MKVIVQNHYGIDQLELSDVAPPVPRAHEVLVRVRAAGIDRGAWHLMTGRPYVVRLFIGLRRPRVRTRGTDAAGTVEAIGVSVTAFRVGDEVVGTFTSGFAELAVTKDTSLVSKPGGLTWEQAAVIPTSAMTALQAMRAARVTAGQSVLVLGASGGVGTFAVQLAISLDARVTGVASSTKLDVVRSLGAHEALDYRLVNVTDGSRRWDAIIDTGGNRSLRDLRRALAPTGTLVLVGGEQEGPVLVGLGRQLRAALASPFTRQRLIALTALARQADLRAVIELADAGTLAPVIDRSWPLADLADAMAHLESGRARGKLVVLP